MVFIFGRVCRERRGLRFGCLGRKPVNEHGYVLGEEGIIAAAASEAEGGGANMHAAHGRAHVNAHAGGGSHWQHRGEEVGVGVGEEVAAAGPRVGDFNVHGLQEESRANTQHSRTQRVQTVVPGKPPPGLSKT